MEHTESLIKHGNASREKATLRYRNLVVGLMLFAAILDIVYWIIWFGGGRTFLATSTAPSYFVFENTFPTADGWLALTLLIGVIGILRRRSWGLLFSLLAGGAGVFLACVDLQFDLQNHIYFGSQGGDPGTVLIEAGIVVLSFGISAILIPYIWRNRAWLLETK